MKPLIATSHNKIESLIMSRFVQRNGHRDCAGHVESRRYRDRVGVPVEENVACVEDLAVDADDDMLAVLDFCHGVEDITLHTHVHLLLSGGVDKVDFEFAGADC